VPIGAIATVNNDQIMIEGVVGALDGSKIHRDGLDASIDDGESAGIELAERLIKSGALQLLGNARSQAANENKAVL